MTSDLLGGGDFVGFPEDFVGFPKEETLWDFQSFWTLEIMRSGRSSFP